MINEAFIQGQQKGFETARDCMAKFVKEQIKESQSSVSTMYQLQRVLIKIEGMKLEV